MADLKQFRFQLSIFTYPKHCFSKTTLCKIGYILITLGTMLPLMGEAAVQQEPSILQYRKADLEVQKLELEVAKLTEDRGELPNWLTGVFGLLIGVIGTAASVWVARLARLGTMDLSVHDKRLELYPQLVKASARLAVYFPSHDPPTTSIGPKECDAMGKAMSAWYFQGGGLLLSVKSRDAYFRFARALTRASLAEDLRVPMFPKDAEDISVEKVDKYRAELAPKFKLDDIENWSFGGIGSETEEIALRFKDYVFLQRLSSTLRSMLSEDLRSRRRPS